MQVDTYRKATYVYGCVWTDLESIGVLRTIYGPGYGFRSLCSSFLGVRTGVICHIDYSSGGVEVVIRVVATHIF